MDLRLHLRQTLAFLSTATEILYGGAAGGGKSHLIRVLAICMCIAVPGLQVYIFRRTFPELKRNHFEGPSSFLVLLAPWINAGYVKYNATEMTLTFKNGAKIHACHCLHESDVYGYQGAEIHVLIMDELTHFTDFIYRYLRARCRTGALVIPPECRWKFPCIFNGTNPGGVGHNWVKATFIDPVPPMEIHRVSDDEGGMLRQFIPAKLDDNPTVNGIEYRKALQGLGRPDLIKAMLEGSWDIVAGGMFDDVWMPKVVRPHQEIPAGWRIDRSFDWGSSHPFSVIWWAEADGTSAKNGWCPKKGSVIAIAELYGWNGKPNEGQRLTAAEIAREILKAEAQMGLKNVQPGPADSAIYSNENGNCIADDMSRVGVRWTPCEKGPGSRVNGWALMRQRMKAACQVPQEEAGLFVFDTCRHIIRTIPTLPRDERKTDDVDSDSEDHCVTGDTEVLTDCGFIPIKGLVGKQGLTLSHDGEWHRFSDCRKTMDSAKIVKIKLSNGRYIRCTDDHLIYTDSGWIEAGKTLSMCIVGSGYCPPTQYDMEYDKCNQPGLPRVHGNAVLPVREVLSEAWCPTTSASVDDDTRGDSKGHARPPLGRGQGEQQSIEPENDERQGSPIGAHDRRAAHCLTGGREAGYCSSPALAQIGRGEGVAQTPCKNLNFQVVGEKPASHLRSMHEAVPVRIKASGTGEVLLQRLQIGRTEIIRRGQCDQAVPDLRCHVHSEQVLPNRDLRQKLRITVEEITDDGYAGVYNLEVEESHSFAIGAGAFVHNCADAMRYRVATKKFTVTTVKGF